ncbi:MAG: folate family ECF transporter S component [Monoglobales bacterium]
MSKKITTKKICAIAMLIALTAVLGFISGKLRIGTFAKFSFNFIAVYFSAILYGPLVAGIVGFAGDFVSAIGTGPYLWWIGAIEFIYGVIFGLLFYKKDERNEKTGTFVLKAISCSAIILIVDLFVKSFLLIRIGFAPSPLFAAVAARLPMCAVMAVIRAVVLIVSEKAILRAFKVIGGDWR